ncbi:stress response protein NST1-like [Cornus florida]|uniref:stress response protein NST1-like n=1 Tax=Cornus florida TaxID=4283 RepID=UPI00289FC4FD|nr:stress response protein NST1-like [Cornus florida]
MPPPRRKKWTEAEERTLIDKYGEMDCDGFLAKMKTREKKYRPIALYVNSMHHVRDPIAYPWQWSWKDVSTKVQNMRHQYSLVKQKIKKPELVGDSGREEFDWVEGLTHWSNFLRYKEVFGDVTSGFSSNDTMVVAADNHENGGGFDQIGHGMEIVQFGHLGHGEDGDFTAGIDGGDDGVIGLEFEYDGEEREENYNDNNNLTKEDGDDGFVYEDIEPAGSDTRKKRKVLKGLEKKAWGFLANQLGRLRELETRFEQREAERERERQRREHLQLEFEQEREQKWEERENEREEMRKAMEKVRRQRFREWEAIEKESEERDRKRKEEELIYEKECGERMNRRRAEWKKRIDEMLRQHRAEIGQIQTRILHEQQNLSNQFLGIVSQWTGHPTGLSDHTGASNHYLSHMMQNLHHVNGIVHGDTRVEGDNQDDQFIVD